MSRMKYCVDQAALCREMAGQMSSVPDRQRLIEMASRYETEAQTLEATTTTNSTNLPTPPKE